MAPVIGFGIFDMDISAKTLETHTILYAISRERKDMSIRMLGQQLLQAIIESVVIFFVPFGNLRLSNVSGENGHTDDMLVFGIIIFTCLIISQLVRCAYLTYTWTWWSLVFWLGSLFGYFAFILTYQVSFCLSTICAHHLCSSLFMVPASSIFI